MADYISRAALMGKLTASEEQVKLRAMSGSDAYNEFLLLVNGSPAADVEPVRHGRWEGYTHSRFFGWNEFGDPIYRDGTVWYCSNRDCRRKTVARENYCPSCGCKMDLEDEK